MKKQQPNKGANMRIQDDVADLFARMEAQESTPDDLRLLMSWAAEHPEKLEEFEALSDIWEVVGEVRPDESIIHGPEKQTPYGDRNVFSSFYQQVAAIAAVFIVAFGIYYYQLPESLDYQTKIGEIKNVALADGSQIHMNGNSAVTVEYMGNKRYLRMGKGEAYFEVAHDKDRVFIVEVGGLLVKAVGTAFNIDYTRDKVTVNVVEGTVEVNLSDEIKEDVSQEYTGLLATVGDKVEFKTAMKSRYYSKETKQEKVILQKDEKVGGTPLAWRKGVLNLDGEPLSIAIERINRQSVKQVAISDNLLRDLPIYGSFYLDNVESFVDAIEVLYPIKHVETEKGYVLRSNKK